MIKNSIFGIFILMVTMFFAAENSFAQPGVTTPGVLPGTLLGGSGGSGSTVNPTNRYILRNDLAKDAMNATNYGSRYLLLLKRVAESNGSGCQVESRAWISRVEANDGSRITVLVGPSRDIRICPGTTVGTVEQINRAEGWIQFSRKWIASLQTNPTRLPGNAFPNAAAWINYYDQYISQQQALIAPIAP